MRPLKKHPAARRPLDQVRGGRLNEENLTPQVSDALKASNLFLRSH